MAKDKVTVENTPEGEVITVDPEALTPEVQALIDAAVAKALEAVAPVAPVAPMAPPADPRRPTPGVEMVPGKALRTYALSEGTVCEDY